MAESVLGQIFSAGNRAKRSLKGFLSDPSSLLRELNEDAAAFMLLPEEERGMAAATAFGPGSVAVPKGMARRGAASLELPVSGAKLELLTSPKEGVAEAAKMVLRPGQGRVISDVTLPDVYKHPELYAAFPELRYVGATLIPQRTRGTAAYSPKDRSIMANYSSPEELLGLLRHETTHAVADITKAFPQGTNPEAMGDLLASALLAAKENLKGGLGSPIDREVLQRLLEGRATAAGYGKPAGFFPYLAQEGEVAANWAGREALPPRELMHNIQTPGDVYSQLNRLPTREQLIKWREEQLRGLMRQP